MLPVRPHLRSAPLKDVLKGEIRPSADDGSNAGAAVSESARPFNYRCIPAATSHCMMTSSKNIEDPFKENSQRFKTTAGVTRVPQRVPIRAERAWLANVELIVPVKPETILSRPPTSNCSFASTGPGCTGFPSLFRRRNQSGNETHMQLWRSTHFVTIG
jgi:hypothetical protein